MRYIWWLLKAALFLGILGFTVKNADPVVVRYYLGQEWHAPLVFVLLLFFVAGVALGILACLEQIVRQRREILALKRDLRVREQAGMERRA
jgi:uncharacterized integral membrane protein